ncbi:hypothetical protein MRB53_022474 [Persea americana]|uniref:Uncharacterized protein n=1 Tax=Persea americana TaxID=3435 RepID=A0ACC2L7I0_PERAE|nr:hypothetical protein MRB53_022474 [Persea americana]
MDGDNELQVAKLHSDNFLTCLNDPTRFQFRFQPIAFFLFNILQQNSACAQVGSKCILLQRQWHSDNGGGSTATTSFFRTRASEHRSFFFFDHGPVWNDQWGPSFSSDTKIGHILYHHLFTLKSDLKRPNRLLWRQSSNGADLLQFQGSIAFFLFGVLEQNFASTKAGSKCILLRRRWQGVLLEPFLFFVYSLQIRQPFSWFHQERHYAIFVSPPKINSISFSIQNQTRVWINSIFFDLFTTTDSNQNCLQVSSPSVFSATIPKQR